MAMSKGGRPRDPRVQDAVLRAAHERLVNEGYARMTIGQVAADAKVGRPTVYRRWADKHELVIDALDYAFRRRRAEMEALNLDRIPARDAVVEAVQRLCGRSGDGTGIRIVAKVMAEADQTPRLLDTLRRHALRPRRELLLHTLRELQERHALRPSLDLETIADMCLGGYLAAFLMTGADSPAEDRVRAVRLVDTIWPYLTGEGTPLPDASAGAP
jgi:AcrR family transcriptional regulator